MAQGPMHKQTAESGPPSAPGEFKTLPQTDSRVKRDTPGRVKSGS